MLLFPVIAWYDIIKPYGAVNMDTLLFPVIAWYDIIFSFCVRPSFLLLFPVIAWYDIILHNWRSDREGCCSQLSLGMI